MKRLLTTTAVLISAGLGLTGCQTTNPSAQWGRVDILNRSVVAGGSIEAESFHHIERDCKSKTLPRLRVVVPPAGGTLSGRPTTMFPSYGPTSPYARCNNRRVPALGVFFAARPGFRGTDTARFEVVWSDGDVWTYTLNVDVR
jgi:hypothetical protein